MKFRLTIAETSVGPLYHVYYKRSVELGDMLVCRNPTDEECKLERVPVVHRGSNTWIFAAWFFTEDRAREYIQRSLAQAPERVLEEFTSEDHQANDIDGGNDESAP